MIRAACFVRLEFATPFVLIGASGVLFLELHLSKVRLYYSPGGKSYGSQAH